MTSPTKKAIQRYTEATNPLWDSLDCPDPDNYRQALDDGGLRHAMDRCQEDRRYLRSLQLEIEYLCEHFRMSAELADDEAVLLAAERDRFGRTRFLVEAAILDFLLGMVDDRELAR